ncbi:ATP-binding protein [Candidatus Micrarchaeota archaeon]|nr:ATP-binding protein [Candidatus Micrarchaeota archaeon]
MVLQRAVDQKDSAMIVISGRRRVGKSRLVDEFLSKNKGLKVIIVPKEEKQAAADLAETLSDEFKPTFNTVKEALEYFFAKSDQRVLYIDEFPNFLEINKSIPYELQRLWEIYNNKTNKVLILSGSYVSMMDKIFTRQKAPLFNRATFKILLDPLSLEVVWEIQDYLGVEEPVQKITNYCVFGGIPYYYVVLGKYQDSPVLPIKTLFFEVGQLREEGQDVLRQEFGAAYRKYFSILEAIGYGLVAAGEIANKMGIHQTTLSKYMIYLQNDFKLIERVVPFDQNKYRSKKGIYRIKDNLLAFWFSNVYGKTRPPSKVEFDLFISKRFELLSMDFFTNWLDKKGEQIVKTGRWWGSVEIEKRKFEQREIDLIVETDKAIYIGECKWTNEKCGESELNVLKQSAKALTTKIKKPVKWVLFSKNGFTIKENEDLLLFDAKKIVESTR